MKRKFSFSLVYALLVFFMIATVDNVAAQEKSKKQLKGEMKLEEQKQMALLVESKEFLFVATRALPQSGNALNLTSYYFAEFRPELIKCDLPFFGRAFSGTGYGGSDGGISFEAKPSDYSIEKKDKYYYIKVGVRGDRDVYTLMLNIFFNGSASLSVTSNNRGPISFDGSIEEIKKDLKATK